MEDKGLDFAKPPLEPDDHSGVNRSVPRSILMRESGMKHKTTNVPVELQWAAEDRLVMRSHEDLRCQLPDVSRSTFLVVFSPDGKKVASTHGNHNVYVTDITTGKNIKTLTGHPRTPWCIAFHPSSNQILASGCLGGQVRVWDLSGGSEIWMAESQTVIASLAFHPIDRMLVVASYNELHFWDWSQPEPFAKCFTSNEKEKVRYVAFDTLGHKLITGIANAPVRPASQWDRVAAPQPPPPPTQQMDSERRITICYRYMVEQYEQLVQRYCDLSRARSTLTMDRGTDPMEPEAETSESQRARASSAPRAAPSTSQGQSRGSLACGTDEASASHSSTEFLSPPPGEETSPLLRVPPSSPLAIRRFNISLPSFSRSRSSSASSPRMVTVEGDSSVRFAPYRSQQNTQPQTRSMSRLALSPETIGFDDSNRERLLSTVRTPIFWGSRNEPSDGTSTEVNSGVESENEEIDVQNVSHSEEESQSSPDISQPSPQVNNSPRTPRSAESSARRTSEASVSQLRSQFHRLQSVYENRNNAYSSHAHVFSPEAQAAERRLLTRLNEILERPLPEPRARRFFVSRRSAFQPRQASSTPSASTATASAAATTSDAIGGVRYGIQLLSRHIDNMQRLCRSVARLEILQLQQIRRMWEDLQSQIYALHGAVQGGASAPATGASAATTPAATSTPPTTAAADLLTDDDSDDPGNNGELHWRQRRTPQTNRRHVPPTIRPSNRFRTRVLNDQFRFSSVHRYHMRHFNRRASSSTQATSEGERGEASSSQVSSTSDERGSERGVKRKNQDRDCDPLFRPRPASTPSTTSTTTPNPGPSTSTSRTAAAMSAAGSSLPAVIRETIVQLENALWRHGNPRHNMLRNTRLSRFTRQREERMMRNLWDTESSHESSRDDQSEGDTSQQSPPWEADNNDTDWTRESTRMRARQVLLLMVDSLTNFFENDNLTQRPTSNEALNDRINNLYVLLQLALNLTDLLLAQLVHSRRELEARRSSMLDSGQNRHGLRPSRYSRSRTSLAWRRILRRAPPAGTGTGDQPTPRRTATSNNGSVNRGVTARHAVFRPGSLPHPTPRPPIVPVVRVNDLPAPPAESTPAPRNRPYSPPIPHPMMIPPRFFYSSGTRYTPYTPAESTSEDSSPAQDRGSDFFFMRAGYGPSSVILTDTPMSPHHRIQAWDFSKYKLPDLGNAEKNIVVNECRIHNDASVDMSKDGRLLVTLLPSGRQSMTTLLGVYSLQWSNLGQLLYRTSFEQSIVSVSLSPTTRHLVVGLASRRVALVSSDRHTNAQVFQLEGALLGQGGLGRLRHQRDLDLTRHLGFMSLNCIRWAPSPGQGLVYGTNTGHLRILR
ncbi:activating molecule in BECN1-regulated autophagy protein 1-like isoform X2 [Macrosteles quadrilineatus]|uniref:activating molecule in BECN1-regulated autophagy protein 1-like isoform X2 n=1 Tax=Macrosteles quadrilineatus TaxID=74068 RepID=UPI0023E151E3|nr:activating molecule in BECN1-regulated autophagy protein 1-like isoform X2 [Macrosteles quadrilineatus]